MKKNLRYLTYGSAIILGSTIGVGLIGFRLDNKNYESKSQSVVRQAEVPLPDFTQGIPVRGNVKVDLKIIDKNGNIILSDSNNYRPSELGMIEAQDNLESKVNSPDN